MTEAAHASHLPKRVLMVDDERPARDDLRRLLGAHSDFEIVDEAGNLADAEVLLRAGHYDVVFLDVMLRGGNGFDLVPSVRPGAAIIFVTGYERFAVRAFEVNALAYLIKPVPPERLSAALEKLCAESAPGAVVPEPTLQFAPNDQVYLKTDKETASFVKIADIGAILSNENYTEVMLVNGRRFLVRRTMKVWEDLLPASHFARMHRTAIVALKRVTQTVNDGRENILLTIEGLPQPVKGRRDLWAELIARGVVK